MLSMVNCDFKIVKCKEANITRKVKTNDQVKAGGEYFLMLQDYYIVHYGDSYDIHRLSDNTLIQQEIDYGFVHIGLGNSFITDDSKSSHELHNIHEDKVTVKIVDEPPPSWMHKSGMTFYCDNSNYCLKENGKVVQSFPVSWSSEHSWVTNRGPGAIQPSRSVLCFDEDTKRIEKIVEKVPLNTGPFVAWDKTRQLLLFKHALFDTRNTTAPLMSFPHAMCFFQGHILFTNTRHQLCSLALSHLDGIPQQLGVYKPRDIFVCGEYLEVFSRNKRTTYTII